MPTSRSYADPCGIARALDIIGDRWALLVVRELIFGPRRFAQLRSGLSGISPNVLAQRLRDLEGAGVLRHDMLGPPASVPVYQLTSRGQALEPVLLELGRWGSQQPLPTGHELSAAALLMALKTLFDPAAAADGTFALRLDGEWYQVTVAGQAIDITRACPAQPAVTLDTDVVTLRSVAFGREPLGQAEWAGRLKITGDRRAAEAFPRMFAAPAPPAASAAPAAPAPPAAPAAPARPPA
jgi:DNA-binding HxlR family transcriptional regulator